MKSEELKNKQILFFLKNLYIFTMFNTLLLIIVIVDLKLLK